MKLTTLLIVTACLQISAAGFSQGITLSEKNAKLEFIFHKIFQQTGYEFFYNSSMLEKAVTVSIEVKNENIEKVLTICFSGQPLGYEVLDKTIIVKQKIITTAPPIDIKGRIMNENDEPVSGATVRVKGSAIAAVTNINGEFLIVNADGKATLIISGAEIETLEVKLNNKPVVNYVVKRKQSELDKVVVMAYGTTTKRLNTGNISKVSSKEIEMQPVSNPLAAFRFPYWKPC